MMIEKKYPSLRHELKYNIDYFQYQILRRKLAAVLKLDPHAGPNGRYHIRSLYFDDFNSTAFLEKMAGVSRRKKYRIRIYNCSDKHIKFERKTKLDQYVFKESVRLTRKDAERIIDGNVDFLSNSKNPVLKAFYLESRSTLMRPVVIVDYYREAYIHPIGNVRITFDIDLHTSLGSVSFFDPNACAMCVNEEQGVILEVKFDDVLPAYIRGLFPNSIRPRSAIGKFAICRTIRSTPVNVTVKRNPHMQE
ncbi:polyphosphate polymerase domain-containing protein [Candidatus Bathyarchaeota archaeon]|nr:polyphosphate polymerase domain-containing protein [Candidatus Bathyarchaeota archaeon]